MSADGNLRTVAWVIAAVALLGAAGAVGMFTFADLSITGRAILLGLVLAVFLVAGATIPNSPTLGMAMATSYFALMAYVLLSFDLRQTVIAVGAPLSLFALIALAYLFHNRRVKLTPRSARYALVGIVLVGALAVGADVRYGDVEYDVALADDVDVDAPADVSANESHPVSIGVVTATNTGPFREELDFPEVRACAYTPDERFGHYVDVQAGSWTRADRIDGGETMAVNMTVLIVPEERSQLNGTVPVERASECPETSDEPKIVAVVDPERDE